MFCNSYMLYSSNYSSPSEFNIPFAFVSPSSAVPALHPQLWSLGCSCVFSSGPLHSLSGTCCRPKGCLIPEAFSALLLCACAVLICLALSSHRPLLRCVCLFLEVLTASALCLGSPSIPNPCVRRRAQISGHCPPVFIFWYRIGHRPGIPTCRLQTSQAQASICLSPASWPWVYKPVLFSSLTPPCIF